MDKLTEIREAQDQTTGSKWIADGFGTVYDDTTEIIIAEVFDNDDAEFIAKSREYITYLLQQVDEMKDAMDKPKRQLLFELHNERALKEFARAERDHLAKLVETQKGVLEEARYHLENERYMSASDVIYDALTQV